VAPLIFDKTGNLYGTTYQAGAKGWGTVFKLSPGANGKWTETVLHSFSGSDGRTPSSGLIFDSTGNLYGTAGFGGNLNDCGGTGCGVVFKVTP